MGIRASGFRRRLRVAVATFAVLVAVQPLGGAAPSGPHVTVPRGYRLELRETLAPGFDHFVMKARRPSQVVHVARISPDAAVALVPVLSNERVSGPRPRTEKTTQMCKRVRCVAAINGDFFARTGVPVGGIVSGGELLRSPGNRQQFIIRPDGGLRMGSLALASSIEATYPRKRKIAGVDTIWADVPEVRSLGLSGVNTLRRSDRVILYTPRYGPRTETNKYGFEIVLEFIEKRGPLRVGDEVLVRFARAAERVGNARIPSNAAVLSGNGNGAKALKALWNDVQAGRALRELKLKLGSLPEAQHAFAGNPVLLRDGKPGWRNEPANYVFRGRHPRTAVGYTRRGEIFLVTVDGRQPRWSTGFTLTELADFMRRLGVVYALNLDGGGSTTFVRHGKVVNKPSDRVVLRNGRARSVRVPARGDRVVRSIERPVALALAVVRTDR